MRAIVTGASGGLGREFAHLCAQAGMDCVLVARSQIHLDELANELTSKYRIKAEAIALDLAVQNAARVLFERVPACDVLINNAGFASSGRFEQIPEQRLLDELQVDVVALTQLTRLYLPGMIERKQGRVLNVASTAGFLPGPFMAVYYAAKAYVISFSEAVHEELRGTGVTLTCLTPGATATGFVERAQTQRTVLFGKLPLDDPKRVARYGFRGMMRGKAMVVPGLTNKLVAIAPHITPRRVLLWISRKSVEPR
jgi:hypothetical protein